VKANLSHELNNTALVCCETLHDEISAVLQKLNLSCPVIWIEQGLHNFPVNLHNRLQETLRGLSNIEQVILGFGYCGNAVCGLVTGDFRMIIPRADDCITLLLGAETRARNEGTYFLSSGWLRGEQHIWRDYQYSIKKYGKKQGKQIIKMMLENYKYLGALDTRFDKDSVFLEETKTIAEELELELRILPASLDYFFELFSGPWPEERFVIIPPRTEISIHLLYPSF
jgi:hypothetical protein